MNIDVKLIGRELLGGKHFRAAPASQGFNRVCVFDAFVIARVGIAAVISQASRVVEDFSFGHLASFFIRITFRVEVLKNRAKRLAHRHRSRAFTRDQNQLAILAFCFQADEFTYFRIDLSKRATSQEISHQLSPLGCSMCGMLGLRRTKNQNWRDNSIYIVFSLDIRVK